MTNDCRAVFWIGHRVDKLHAIRVVYFLWSMENQSGTLGPNRGDYIGHTNIEEGLPPCYLDHWQKLLINWNRFIKICIQEYEFQYVVHGRTIFGGSVLKHNVEETNEICHRVISLKGIGVVRNLTRWGRDKMATVFQMTYSNGFSWLKTYAFWLKCHWNLFLGCNYQYCCIGSAGIGLLVHICVTRSQWVN